MIASNDRVSCLLDSSMEEGNPVFSAALHRLEEESEDCAYSPADHHLPLTQESTSPV